MARYQDPYHAKKKPSLFPVHFSHLSSSHLVSVALEAGVSLYLRTQDNCKFTFQFLGGYRILPKISWEVGLNPYGLIKWFDKNLLILDTNFKDNYFSKFFVDLFIFFSKLIKRNCFFESPFLNPKGSGDDNQEKT